MKNRIRQPKTMNELKIYLSNKYNIDGNKLYNQSKHELETLKSYIQKIIVDKYPRRRNNNLKR